ncbi:MAG: NUDIX hydrolase [Candidatus Woykebacteria bacterium]
MEKVSVVAVHIEQGSKILMVQEKGRAWGLWSIPIGHVDEGETLEQAAIRELKEETGYDIEVTQSLGQKAVSDTEYKGGEKDVGKQIEINFFEGKIIGGELKPDLEGLLDVRWVEKDKVLDLPLRGDWLKDILTHD